MKQSTRYLIYVVLGIESLSLYAHDGLKIRSGDNTALSLKSIAIQTVSNLYREKEVDFLACNIPCDLLGPIAINLLTSTSSAMLPGARFKLACTLIEHLYMRGDVLAAKEIACLIYESPNLFSTKKPIRSAIDRKIKKTFMPLRAVIDLYTKKECSQSAIQTFVLAALSKNAHTELCAILFDAIIHHNNDMLLLLLGTKTRLNIMSNLVDDHKKAPLMVAARNDNIEAAKLLLAHKADISYRIPEDAPGIFSNKSAIDFARASRHDDMVAFLLKQGAQED